MTHHPDRILYRRQMRLALRLRAEGYSGAAIARMVGISNMAQRERFKRHDACVAAGRDPFAPRVRPDPAVEASLPVEPRRPEPVWTDARRIAATRMLRAGRSLPVIAARLNKDFPGAPVETAHIVAAFRGAPWVQLRGAA
jgi:hypothetical protein